MDEPKKQKSPILEIWRRLKGEKKEKKTDGKKSVPAEKQEEKENQ